MIKYVSRSLQVAFALCVNVVVGATSAHSATLDDAFSYIGDNKTSLSQVKSGQSLASEDETEEMDVSLVSLGREEGRPLKSTLIRVAITPWCHVFINRNMCSELNKQNIEVLTKAFRSSLIELHEQ